MYRSRALLPLVRSVEVARDDPAALFREGRVLGEPDLSVRLGERTRPEGIGAPAAPMRHGSSFRARMSSAATLASVVAGVAVAALAQAGPPYGDAPVFARIDAARAIAEDVVIDGAEGDWNGTPAFADPAGDAGGDASRDITSVSIAPLADALLVRIATSGAPFSSELAFWLYFDFMAHERLDVEIGLYPIWPDIVWTYPEGGAPSFQRVDVSELAVGGVVEARIPYTLLGAALPPAMASALAGPGARSWVRVFAFSTNGAVVDRAPAVASFRLAPTPYVHDPPLPPGGDTPFALPLPLATQQYVGQGAFGLFTHATTWAYDLNQVTSTLDPDSPSPSSDLADYLSFGEPLTAPLAGTVVSREATQPDQPPRTSDPFPPPNFVFLDVGSSVALLFSHMRQNTVPVSPTQAVAAGAALGQVGHSGSNSWPHLHLEARQWPADTPTLPLGLLEVEVGLNPGAADPWQRRMAEWPIREGFLVERAGAFCGDLDLDDALAPADAALLRSHLAGGATLGAEALARCTVIAPARPCDIRDAVVLRRALEPAPLAPGVAQVCPGVSG